MLKILKWLKVDIDLVDLENGLSEERVGGEGLGVKEE